ncbi:alpha-tubulin N-acetyltransferase 1-like isoform X2 [Adelges cooleyi]|nr:alpha-tubulin N-acetyltransferase 1-like isoform X2 [Adelges cooleyi]
MEFQQFDLRKIAHEQIVKIDNKLLPVGQQDDPELQAAISKILDDVGLASGIAQDLKMPITSAEKLRRSDHTLYLMTEITSEGHLVVVGLLKMGWKKLYLFDRKGKRTEAMVYCLLDFYIHETRQRHGYGITLLNHMLRENRVQAKQLAIDQPTNKLLQFMWKHFGLSKLVNQGNNFVIFEEFFDTPAESDIREHSEVDNRSGGYKSQATFGRHGASRQQDCMADILYGNNGVGHTIITEKKEDNQVEIEVNNQAKAASQNHEVDANSYHKTDDSQRLDLKNYHTQL